jgi:two-component system alkaline phosphatase synthesis response regulator PhoP
MSKLLIVEDEASILDSLRDFFSLHHEVITAADGNEGLRKGLNENPDLVILDIMLPGMHGLDVCKRLRDRGFTAPVLFLTAKGQELDKLTGFDVGADDYITKPFSLLELQARVRAALRRATTAREEIPEETYGWDGITADFATYEVSVRGEIVKLSAKEMELLRFMLRHRGKVLSREILLEKVWHYDADVSTRTVDTHILNLRRKLPDPDGGCRYIQTVHGVGYKFVG